MKNGQVNYYQDGHVIRTDRYRNDQLNGKSIKYENGKENVTYFKNGVLDSVKIKAQVHTPAAPKPATGNPQKQEKSPSKSLQKDKVSPKPSSKKTQVTKKKPTQKKK